jgi:hypothetical protein
MTIPWRMLANSLKSIGISEQRHLYGQILRTQFFPRTRFAVRKGLLKSGIKETSSLRLTLGSQTLPGRFPDIFGQPQIPFIFTGAINKHFVP